MPQARIKTTFGEIVIAYSDVDELTKELEKLPKAIALVQAKTTGLVPSESRKSKPGYENLYEFDSNGRLRLLKKPNKQVALAALALWANDPDPMNSGDLELLTGISEIVKSVLSQTNNKKYFVRREDGRYGLTPQGFEWVSTTVAPSLK
jgi:hypothetical protein